MRRGVRAQNAAGLERLARRIEPDVGWDDLVLPPTVLRGLQQVAARAKHRDTVLTDWKMRRGGPWRGTPSGWQVITGSYLFVHMSSSCTLSQCSGLYIGRFKLPNREGE